MSLKKIVFILLMPCVSILSAQNKIISTLQHPMTLHASAAMITFSTVIYQELFLKKGIKSHDEVYSKLTISNDESIKGMLEHDASFYLNTTFDPKTMLSSSILDIYYGKSSKWNCNYETLDSVKKKEIITKYTPILMQDLIDVYKKPTYYGIAKKHIKNITILTTPLSMLAATAAWIIAPKKDGNFLWSKSSAALSGLAIGSGLTSLFINRYACNYKEHTLYEGLKVFAPKIALTLQKPVLPNSVLYQIMQSHTVSNYHGD